MFHTIILYNHELFCKYVAARLIIQTTNIILLSFFRMLIQITIFSVLLFFFSPKLIEKLFALLCGCSLWCHLFPYPAINSNGPFDVYQWLPFWCLSVTCPKTKLWTMEAETRTTIWYHKNKQRGKQTKRHRPASNVKFKWLIQWLNVKFKWLIYWSSIKFATFNASAESRWKSQYICCVLLKTCTFAWYIYIFLTSFSEYTALRLLGKISDVFKITWSVSYHFIRPW